MDTGKTDKNGLEKMVENGAQVARDGKRAAKKAARSPWVERLVRLGFFVHGLVYALVGLLAIQVALGGRGGQVTDRQGAIAAVAAQPFGRLLLILILVGLAGYALWGVVRAFVDPLNYGSNAKGIARRAGSLATTISYGALMLPTWRTLQNRPGGAEAGSASESAQETVSSLLTRPWGPWVVGLAGLVVLAVGVGQIATGLKAKFDLTLDPYKLSAGQRKWATRLGRAGYVARGIVFAITGILLVQAARLSDPQRARGMDGALLELSQQPYGWLLLAVVAAGLIAFGAYSILGAFWFRLKQA